MSETQISDAHGEAVDEDKRDFMLLFLYVTGQLLKSRPLKLLTSVVFPMLRQIMTA